MWHHPIGRLRILGWMEGISLLSLLFVAVPLKYVLAEPQWVERLGPVHGTLFMLYVVACTSTSLAYAWTWPKIMRLWIAAILPFGTFFNDGLLAREQAQQGEEM